MTVEADIAAIADDGNNSASTVRTAMTSTLNADPFVVVVDDPLTTTDDVTTYSGTWSINTYLQCVVATSTACRALSDTQIGGAGTVIQCEVEIPTGFTTANQLLLIGEAESNSNAQVLFGLRGDGRALFEADAVATLANVAYSIPAAGTWVTVRVVQLGDRYDGYVDGVLTVSQINNQGNNGPRYYPMVKAYSTTAMTARFRNLKAWNYALPS